MTATAGRLLSLLAVLQASPGWSAAALAVRLGVGERTIRNDVSRLRELGYPIESAPGRGGGYRLGRGGRIPPLLLDDDEAVAVAVALGLLARTPGVAEAGRVALGKLEQTLSDRLRRRVRAVHDALDVGPANTASNAETPPVDPALLSELGLAIRDRAGLRLRYRPQRSAPSAAEPAPAADFEADPYRLVSWQERWYLVARDRRTRAFRALRADWLTVRTPGASRFAADPLPGGDYAGFVLREVASSGWAVHARIRVDAPAGEVLARINPTVGVVETVDEQHSILVTGADTLELVAVWIGMLGLDFHVDSPPELVAHLRTLARRYQGAVPEL